MASNRVGLLRIKLVSRGKNQTTNNSSGFNAPLFRFRGYREHGLFINNSNQTLFWCSTSSNDVLGWYSSLNFQFEFTYLTNGDSIWKQGGMQGAA